MIQLAAAVGFAIIISAGCSLFEAVLYSVPIRHIETLAQRGKSSGKIFRKLRANIEQPIAAILSLNTIANTAGAAFAGSAASAVFGSQYLGYFSALFTLAVLILSEIIPKTTGVVYARSLVPLVAHPLKVIVWIMTPVIWVSSLVTRLIGGRKTEDVITAEEIRVMSRLSLRSGGIKTFQNRAIENILTLQNKKAKDVMTPRTVIFSLSEHLTLDEAGKTVNKWEHSRFPVYDQDMEDVVGIVLTKDFFLALAEGRMDRRLTDLMRPVNFVVETARLSNVLTDFLELKQHLFVVLDEYGGLSGLISLEDILEEIIGREIVDESDEVADKRELARQRRTVAIKSTTGPPVGDHRKDA
jgi:CBS domain containing-hemolysin-like protein